MNASEQNETAAVATLVNSTPIPFQLIRHFSLLIQIRETAVETLITSKLAMVDSRRWRSWWLRKRKRGRRQCGGASSSAPPATLSLLLLLLLLVVPPPPRAGAQPFTINTSTNEVSHIPWIVEDAVVANQVSD